MTNKIRYIFLLFLCSFFMSNAKTRKTVYVVLDGIPADYVERLHPNVIYEISGKGNYKRAFTGGEIGHYSQTPTISAIGYMNILTGTWMNKHNVNGNSNLSPNYNYWSLFRIAKSQKKEYTTALFSSWTDNRTVLIGEGIPETNNLKIDYVSDGFDLDKKNFPSKENHLEIDSIIAQQAATCIRKYAPDLSWVYLWYTDSGYHLYGDGEFMDRYVYKTDSLLSHIWEAVKYREEKFNEEWMVVITTDHGRTESGHSHGGQSFRERSCWVATNLENLNDYFHQSTLSLVDINPSICDFMGFDVPRDISFERDGVSFVNKIDVYDLKTQVYDQTVTLQWKYFNNSIHKKATVYLATTNKFKEGKTDEWLEVGEVAVEEGEYKIDLSLYPGSKFYKFVVATDNNHITRWLKR